MPTIEEFYNLEEYDSTICDMLKINKQEFEDMWDKAKKYCEVKKIKPIILT